MRKEERKREEERREREREGGDGLGVAVRRRQRRRAIGWRSDCCWLGFGGSFYIFYLFKFIH